MDAFNYNDDDDDEGNWDTPITGRNSFVLLLDAGANMFQLADKSKSYFQLSMECCREILLNIARKQKMELVSIVFYGTQSTEGRHAPENVVLYDRPSVVTVSRLNRLKQLIEGKCEVVKSSYGHSPHYVLSQALHYCQALIIDSRTKTYVKNIIIFTRNDDPHPGDRTLQHQARKQAEELLGHHIDLDVVGLGEFDSSKFYKELVLTSKGELLKDWVHQDPILSMSTLVTQVDRITEKFSQRRSYLWLGNECCLQVSLSKLYNEPKKCRMENVTVETQKLEGASRVMADVDDDQDSAYLEEEDVNSDLPSNNLNVPQFNYQNKGDAEVKIGQSTVPITRTELKTDILGTKKFGFTLVGFVNSTDVPLYLTRREPYFMTPASNATNIRLIFSHLLNACLDKGKSMIGWFKLTKSSNPCYVILHPTSGGEYAKDKEHSPGFFLSRLSYVDDLNEPDEGGGESAQPSEKQLEAAAGIVKKLTINYHVGRFSDAEVRYRTNMIEALALDYDDVEPVEDDTDVDLEGIAERLGKLNEQFNDCEHLGPEKEGKGKQGNYGNKAAKNSKMGSNPIEMIQNGYADKLSVAQLKDLLKSEGVKNLSSMNKSLLVSIANQRFGKTK